MLKRAYPGGTGRDEEKKLQSWTHRCQLKNHQSTMYVHSNGIAEINVVSNEIAWKSRRWCRVGGWSTYFKNIGVVTFQSLWFLNSIRLTYRLYNHVCDEQTRAFCTPLLTLKMHNGLYDFQWLWINRRRSTHNTHTSHCISWFLLQIFFFLVVFVFDARIRLIFTLSVTLWSGWKKCAIPLTVRME